MVEAEELRPLFTAIVGVFTVIYVISTLTVLAMAVIPATVTLVMLFINHISMIMGVVITTDILVPALFQYDDRKEVLWEGLKTTEDAFILMYITISLVTHMVPYIMEITVFTVVLVLIIALPKKTCILRHGPNSCIQIHFDDGVELFRQGVYEINRGRNQWSISGGTIELIHENFVECFNQMNIVNNHIDGARKSLDRDLEKAVVDKETTQRRINTQKNQLRQTKLDLTCKEQERKAMTELLETLQSDYMELERKLENREEDREKTRKLGLSVSAAGIPLALAGLVFPPALVGAAALAGTSVTLVTVLEEMKKNIKSFKKAIERTTTARNELFQNVQLRREEERKLESSLSDMNRRLDRDTRQACELRRTIARIAQQSAGIRCLLDRLAIVMNLIESLKTNTDPDYFYDVSVLRGPIEELEELLAPRSSLSITGFSSIAFL